MKHKSTPAIATFLAILVCSVFLVVLIPSRQKGELGTLPGPILATRRSEIEQKDFFRKRVEPILMEIFGSKFRIPEIQERYTFLAREVKARFGSFNMNLVTNYSTESHDVSFGCSTTGGKAQIDVIMPKQMDIWEEFRQSGNPKWQEQFELHVIVSLMHEMEHLVADPPGADKITKTLEGLVQLEKTAWGLTCRHSIAPLIEKYNLPVSPSDRLYYDDWVRAGRNEQSPIFDVVIRQTYSQMRTK